MVSLATHLATGWPSNNKTHTNYIQPCNKTQQVDDPFDPDIVVSNIVNIAAAPAKTQWWVSTQTSPTQCSLRERGWLRRRAMWLMGNTANTTLHDTSFLESASEGGVRLSKPLAEGELVQ